MAWFNKVVWGTLGYALGGPLGGVLGAFAGHAFDQQSEAVMGSVRRPHRASGLNEVETRQGVFFAAMFSLLGKMAKADGQVSAEEVRVVDDFIRSALRLAGPQRQVAIDIFNQAKDSDYTFQSFADQFYEAMGHSHPMMLQMLDMLYRVAAADGTFHPAERKLLDEAAVSFRLSKDAQKQIQARYIKDTDRYYAVLGCEPGDSMDTIKKAYRRLATEHHPDRLVAKGMPEEFVAEATERLQVINEAYEAISQQRT